MLKTISKRITNGTGKSTLKHRRYGASGKKATINSGKKTKKKLASNVYSVGNDPMIPLLKAAGFREMTAAEYAEVRPYLKPKKSK